MIYKKEKRNSESLTLYYKMIDTNIKFVIINKAIDTSIIVIKEIQDDL